MNRYSAALVSALFLGVFSQLVLKQVSVEILPELRLLPEWIQAGIGFSEIVSSFRSLHLWYGLLLLALSAYALSVFAWLVALQRFSLSQAYPFLSLGYVLVYVFAVLMPGLNETVSWSKSLGIFLVLTGVALCMRKSTVAKEENAKSNALSSTAVYESGRV